MKPGNNSRLLALMNVADDLYREPALAREQWTVSSIKDAPKALERAQAKTLEMEIFLSRLEDATKILSMNDKDQMLTIAERLKEMCTLIGAHIPPRNSGED